MQWKRVVERGTTAVFIFFGNVQPAVKHGGIVINRRTIKAQQNNRQICLIHQFSLHAAIFANFFQKTAELAVMPHHQVLGKAQFRKVIKQIAVVICRLQSQRRLLPMLIHRDEAMAECLAAKQPVGEYRSDALAAEEILTLANWCLLNYSGLKTPVGSAS